MALVRIDPRLAADHFVAGIVFIKKYLPVDNATDEWYACHLWTLSLEEQFYLLLPAALAFCGVSRGRRVTIGLLALVPVVRIAWYFLLPLRRRARDAGCRDPFRDRPFPLGDAGGIVAA